MIHFETFMFGIYLFLSGATLLIEITNKFNTDNVLKKIGLLTIFLGCMIHMSGQNNNLIPIGLAFYWGVILARTLLNRYHRRTTDPEPERARR